MEDPTKLDNSGSSQSFGDENTTAIKGNTTGDARIGDFVAGTVLASRYRIIGLVGKGGMGEVYKAEDIKLSQTVALKFLPDRLERDKDALDSFHAEVRNSRQVSHPNVCRVFDIGEIDGRHFISMEFVDGDDLSALLTRVGRFTSERAIEISRQLCVGMEAIHKAGILHRDFKPANIIIDRRGTAKITDFGIAGIETEIAKDGIRAGTPAYMSPEQITGKDVTTRSDIYSLGLVLYEIFTGKQTFVAANVPDLIKKHQTETPTNPSQHVKGIDPLVESVIAQCLEKDPKNRPQSGLQVAMALPGGNPLQIALDAGQTPSPEMVAASPKKGALRPAVAVSFLATVIISIGLLMLLAKQTQLVSFVPLERSQEVLGERGRELTEKLGYPSADSYYGVGTDEGYIDYVSENDKTPIRWQRLATGQPAVVRFWYRSSPAPLVPLSGEIVNFKDPPNNDRGMVEMRLDMKGRLIYFTGVPAPEDTAIGSGRDLDWVGIFKEAGFDLANFQSADSELTPLQAFDEHRAWIGNYPELPGVAIRVEAAAFRGQLVSFDIIAPWNKTVAPPANEVVDTITWMFLLSLFFAILGISTWLAIKNVGQGRSNVKGALRIAYFLFVLRMLTWAFSTHHVPYANELGLFVSGLQSALFWSCFAGFMYLAFEPYLRKYAPERVVSWNRLLAGDWRNPLVGRDILIGGAIALVTLVFINVMYAVPIWLGETPRAPDTNFLYAVPFGAALLGIRGFPLIFLSQMSFALLTAFAFSFLLVFAGLLLRRKWLGVVAVWLILGVPLILSVIFEPGLPFGVLVATVAVPTSVVLTAARFGALASMSGWVFFTLWFLYPITTKVSAWYAGDFVLCILTLAAISVFGFYTSTSGQKLWRGKLLEE